MKFKFLGILTLPILLSSCTLTESAKVKKHLVNTEWKGSTLYDPIETYTLSFKNTTYSLTYHKDAIHTTDVDEDAVDLTADGKWTYDGSETVKWTGDWNIPQKMTYYVVKLDTHPLWGEAYFQMELNSNVIYLTNERQTGKNLMVGIKLVKQGE